MGERGRCRGYMWLLSLILPACGGGTGGAGGTEGTGGTGGTALASSSTTGGTEGPTSAGQGSSGGESSTSSDGGSSGTGVPMPPPEGPFGSGTRLRAVYLSAGPGAVRLLRWYDTELELDCRFAHDTAWQPRCMPSQGADLEGYLDSDCTQPVARQWQCDDTPSMVSVALPERCAGPLARTSAFEVGAAQAVATLYRLESGECVFGNAPAPSEMFYPLSPVDDEMWLAGDTIDYPLEGALGTRIVQAADGAFEKLEPVNTDEGVNCFALDIGGELRCVSANLAYDFGDLRPDPACNDDPVAYSVSAPQCGEVTVVIANEPTGEQCPAFLRTLRAVDGEVDDAYDINNACMPTTRGATARFWTIGADLPPSHAPPIAEAYFGRGRGQSIDFASSDGTWVASGFGWRDSELEVDCDPLPATDGTQRCVPSARVATVVQGVGGLFADAGCTDEPVARYTPRLCEPPGTTMVVSYTASGGPCFTLDLDDVTDVGPEYSGPVYRQDGPGEGCTPYTPSEDEQIFELGASQGLDALIEVQLVTE